MNSPEPTTAHHEAFTTLNRLKLPSVMKAVGWLLLVAFVGLGLFLAFTPWVQTSVGAGSVTALNPNDRQQDINALVPGRIQDWFVRDGSRVSNGDPIVQLVDNDPLLLDRLEAERRQVVAKLDAARSALTTASRDEQRMQDLFDEGLASRRDYEQARIRVDQLRANVAEAAAELSRAQINISRQSVQVVRAPRDGTILSVNAGANSTFVRAGDVVATFVPDNVVRAIELFIDGRDVALVRPGAKVRLQFEGWPVVQFSGWPSVAIGTFGGEVAAVDPSAQANGRFRILVVADDGDSNPWPDERFVRFGAKVRGWVLLDRVSVGYEIWRQLNNFPPNFPNTGAAAGG